MLSTKTSTAEWVVARLNYSEPWECFLVKSVKPLVDTLTQTGIVERYYWERAYERGAHIRLSLRGDVDKLNALVLPNLKDHFLNYFADKPSQRPQESPDWEPNNSVQLNEYAVDLVKWGGFVGVPIAERFFQSSSDCSLHFMAKSCDTWSNEPVLQTAFYMHLGFADAAGLDTIDAIRFFEYCLAHHATEHFSVHHFEEWFKREERTLLDFHSKLWSNLKTGNTFDDKNYNRWLDNCYYTAADLRKTFHTRHLSVEPRFASLWQLYAQLLRFINNQLGLFGKDESLAYYLSLRSLEVISLAESQL